jgi:predicted exporter
MKRQLGLIQGLVAMILLIFVLIMGKANFQADILSLLPQDVKTVIQDAESHFFDGNKRHVFISFSGKDAKISHDHFISLSQRKPWFNVKSIDLDLEKSVQFYLPYQGYLLADNLSEALTSPESYSQFASQKLSEVVNPFVSASIAQDPSLSTAEFVEQAYAANDSLALEDGRLIARSPVKGQQQFILIFTIDNEALNVNKAITVAEEIKQVMHQVERQYPDCVVKYSGVLFHTAENSSQAQFEMSFFGGLSLFAMLVMVYFVFRSRTALLSVTLTIANAVIYGFIALALSFDSVHIISLVFGVTLIGISIDYCFHVLTELHNKKPSLTTVNKSIFLGFISTALGYILLTLAPMSFLSQVATFIIAGLVGAMVCVFTVVPNISSSKSGLDNLVLEKQLTKLINLIKHFQVRRVGLLIVISTLVFVSYLLLPIKFNDSIADLNGSSSTLLSNENFHQKILSGQDVKRLFILGSSIEQVLQTEEAIRTRVSALIAETDVSSKIVPKATPKTMPKVRGISDWLPSKQRQHANNKRLKLAQSHDVFSSWHEATGLEVTFSSPAPLTYQAIKNSVVAPYVSPFLYVGSNNGSGVDKENKDEFVSLLQLSNISSAQLVSITESFGDQVIPFDKAESISQIMTDSRESLLSWFMLALIIFSVVIGFRFGLKAAGNHSLALILSVSIALMLSYLVQGPLNLFNVLAMMLILALAIDYLIFYQYRGTNASNVLAISLSALSSLFVFGVLVFSKTPAVYSFGLTVMLGIVSIFILAPLSVVNKEEQ